ncbi:hypothetical protein D3C72_1246460 [compost metagenome]
MRIAPAARRLAAGQVVGVHVGQHRHLHVQQRHVDVLAFAGAVAVRQRRQHGDGGVLASHQVGDGHAGLLRAAAGQVVALAGQAHEAAHALDDEVIARARGVRAGLAEAGDRAVDQVGLDLPERLIVQAVLPELADLVVLQHHVALRGQVAHDLLALGRADVAGDRALVAVGGQVVGGLGGVAAVFVLEPGRAPGAGIVAGAGALDLDHIGAEIGKVLGAPWPGEDAGQVEDAEMAQGSHGSGGSVDIVGEHSTTGPPRRCTRTGRRRANGGRYSAIASAPGARRRAAGRENAPGGGLPRIINGLQIQPD